MASKKTKDLVKLIEKKAGDPNSSLEAQQLIDQGADIKSPTANGTMIESVINEANRHQKLSPQKAQCCQQLIQVLIKHASKLLAACVLSADGDNLAEIKQLVRLHANCYQGDIFGPLGLLGELLKQNKISVRLDVVQFLIETDNFTRFALTKIDNQQQTYLSLSKVNPKCSADVKDYLQKMFDIILNKAPLQAQQIAMSEVIQWIRQGANPEAVDERRNTVLSNAVLANNLQLVQTLISAGCNVAHVNNDNLTPLGIAKNATPRNAQLVAILEAQNINTELKQLIESKRHLLTVDEISALLNKGASINAVVTNNSTPLHLLIANEGTPEMVTVFVNDFNADISAMDIRGYRAVEFCILFDKSPYVGLQTFLSLPKVSTTVFFNTRLNKSILQFAQDQHRLEAVKIIQNALNTRLWNMAVQANAKDEHNKSLALGLKQLIDFGAQIDHQHVDEEYEQWTILHLACKTTTQAFVQYLITTFRANYTLPNGNGDYPISIAAEYGHLSMVQYLHGFLAVQLNVSNKEKQTPLHLATKNHHLLVVRYLLLWGADHCVVNINKQTPLDIARTNTNKDKNDEITNNMLIYVLQQLICAIKTDEQQDQSVKPDYDLDTCELITPVIVDPIQVTSVGDEERLGRQNKGIFSGNANDNLFSAAKEGSVQAAKAAIGEGANICYRKDNRTAYDVAQQAIIDYQNKCTLSQARPVDHQMYQQRLAGCKQIAEDIRQIAFNKINQGIAQSQAYHVVAYHQAGGPLAADFLFYTCNTSDNVQIVDYLVNQSPQIYQTMFTYSTDTSPYQIAKKKKFNNVASYLKYRLSVECTKAIEKNDIELVKKLMRAGANVDMHNTNNLQTAIKQKNIELIQILLDNGAKMPTEWLRSPKIILPENVTQAIDSHAVFRINRSLINRRLHIAAACGDLTTLTQCQHLSADINSQNCYGSTALLCSIQHGNYFPIVHALVSHGATMLHSNENESPSLIALAKKRNYTYIADYLSQELNVQFLIAIINNDLKSAEKFAALGADFNYQDGQKRTALHYAVQYYGIELVSWLCLRGSTPTMADINDNYAITEAAEKGIFSWFIRLNEHFFNSR